jgi:hypothetical protein
MAVLKGKSVTDYVERALRKQIDEDNREAGRQGYKIGQGGMYIPPPPSASGEGILSQQSQSQSQQQLQQEELYKLKDEKWTVMDEHRRISALWNFVGKVAEERGINGEEATRLIMKQKDLLKKVADEIGTEDEAYIYYHLKGKIDDREKIREMKKLRDEEERKKMEAKKSLRRKKKKIVNSTK